MFKKGGDYETTHPGTFYSAAPHGWLLVGAATSGIKGHNTANQARICDFWLSDGTQWKYKFRVTQITYEPGGYTGDHHHVGPGIRYVASGELTFVEQDKTRIYKTGDYYFESGDLTHTAINNTSSPTVLINIEILPADWKGGTAVPPKSK
jgi:quercetin dioxygenase-like cupin family protein